MNGRSKDFKVKINRKAVAEIYHTAFHEMDVPKEIIGMLSEGAPKEDFDTALILKALINYLQEQRCEPDFELVLSE